MELKYKYNTIIYLFKVSIDLNKLIDKFFNSNNPKS